MPTTVAVLLAALGAPGAASPAPEPTPAPLSVRPFGYAQADLHAVLGGDRGDDVRDTLEVRRLRLGGEVRWRSLRAEVDVDPLDGREWLKDAYLEVRPTRDLRLRAGWQKLPTLPDRDRGAARIDFVERTIASDRLAPARDVGLSVRGRASRAALTVGAFAGDAYRERHRAGFTLAGRLDVEPARSVVIGAIAATSDVPDAEDPKGRDVEGPSGLELWPRSPVLGRRSRLGGDAAWGGRGWRLAAEVVRTSEQTPTRETGLDGDAVATAWAAAAQWRTGGKKDDGRGPFLVRKAGALGVRVRVEGARLRDPLRGGPRTGTVLTGGLGWRPHGLVLLTGDVAHERADAVAGGRRSRTTAFVRLQLEAPWGESPQ